MSKVLIIGAGGVGTVVAHKCAQNRQVFNEIVLASRTRSKCDAIVKAIGQPDIVTDSVDADSVPQLVELLTDSWREIRYIERRADFDRLVRALALWSAQLARCGVLVKDFSPGNVLMRDDGAGSWEFALVDVNRMAFDIHDPYRLAERAGYLIDTEAGMKLWADTYAEALHLDPKRTRRATLGTYYRLQQKVIRRK